MRPACLTLALSLSRIALLVSPLPVVVQPYLNTAAAGQVGIRPRTQAAGAGAAIGNRSPSRGWVQHYYCCRRRISTTERSWGQCSLVLRAVDEEGGQDARTYTSYSPTAEDVGMPEVPVYHELDEEDEDGETSNSHLKTVVAQLRGDIQAGTTPQVRSRVKLDGLFAELRADQPADGSPSQNSTATTSAASTTAAETASTTPPREASKAQARRPPPSPNGEAKRRGSTALQSNVTSGAIPRPRAAATPGEDLESLSDMLARLQASAKARDLAEAGARAEAIGSGGPLGERFSPVTIAKHRDMMKRFTDIREGRVSWAILPLVMRARKAGIPLSTGVYNAAIAAYFSTPRKYADALRVLDLLKRSGQPDVRPDLTSYNIAMRVCGEAGKWQVVLKVGGVGADGCGVQFIPVRSH